MSNSKFIKLCGASVLTLLPCFSESALAGGCAPGQPCWEEEKPRVTRPATKVTPRPRREIRQPAPVTPPPPPLREETKVMDVEESGSRFGIAAGINVLYFDCESTEVAPGIFADFRPDEDIPINLRLGVEGTQIDSAEQFQFRGNTAVAGNPDLDFIRIPLSVEYVQAVSENTDVFVGGGPDLIDISGDGDDTTVGLHLGARVQQNFTENIGLSVGAGYLFAEADQGPNNEELDLDSAFTGAHLTVGF